MVTQARFACPECTFHVGEIASMQLPRFDAIVSKDMFNHVLDVDATIVVLDGLLETGGVFVAANRDRGGNVREAMMEALARLGYSFENEDQAFAPTPDEINSFLRTLTGFTERHVEVVRQRLQAAGAYYLFATSRETKLFQQYMEAGDDPTT